MAYGEFAKIYDELINEDINYDEMVDCILRICNENNIEFKVDRAKDKDIVKATIRPDDIKIVNEDSENTIDGTVEIRTFLGKAYQYDVKTSIGNLIVNSENSVVYEKGNKVKLQLPSNKIVIL